MKKPRINFSKIAGIFLVIVIGLLVFGNWRLFSARKKIDFKLKEVKESFQAMSKEQEVLQGNILQSQNYDYLELVGREELNFKKPGEQVVAFPDQNIMQETDTSKKIRDLWNKFMEMRKRGEEERE